MWVTFFVGVALGVWIVWIMTVGKVEVQGEEGNLFVVVKNNLYYLVGPIRGKV